MAKKKRSTRRTKRASVSTTPRRRTYRRRSSSGLSGLMGVKSPSKAALKDELIEVAATAAGIFAAAKGTGLLDKQINKSGTTAMVPPAIVAVAGAAGVVFMKDKLVKAVAKGVMIGGAFKVIEKALRKDNILSGVDDDDRPLMLPGIGDFGQAHLPEHLPELPHYSENPQAPVTATGGDHSYHMGTPSEVLSGDDDLIAY